MVDELVVVVDVVDELVVEVVDDVGAVTVIVDCGSSSPQAARPTASAAAASESERRPNHASGGWRSPQYGQSLTSTPIS